MVSYRIVQLCVREPSASAVCVCRTREQLSPLVFHRRTTVLRLYTPTRHSPSQLISTIESTDAGVRVAVARLLTYSLHCASVSLQAEQKVFSCATPLRHSSISLLNVSGVPSISFWGYKALDINPTTSHSVNSPLSPSITPSLFHPRLKTYPFHKSFPP